MAQMKRAGGNIKQTVPVANNVRNVPQAIIDIFNEELVERMFEEFSIPVNKIVGGGMGILGEISSGNTTTTALNNGQTFIGTGELNNFGDVLVGLKTDQSGMLFMEFSNDGTNWDSSLSFEVIANFYEIHKLTKGSRYFRVRFTNNSGSNQTFLRLITVYGSFGLLTAPLNGTVTADADAIVVRSRSTSADIALGKFQGILSNTKFGRNSNLDSLPEDIWEGGGIYTGQPTGSPETVDITSTLAADDLVGTGMQTIRIYGLATSTSTEEQTEDIDLDGTNPVTSLNTWYRIYRAEGIAYGSGGTNAGNITIQHTTTTANVFAVLQAGYGQTAVGAVTVPSGKTMIIKRLYIAMARANGAAGSAVATMRTRPNTGGGYNAKRVYDLTNSSAINYVSPIGISVPENTDIKFTIESVSNTGSFATVEFEYELIGNI